MADEGQQATPAEEVSPEEAPVVEAKESAPTPDKKMTSKTKKRRRWVPWTIGTIAVVALLAGAAWKLKWYLPIFNRVYAASVTIKVREDEQYALQGATVTFRGNTYATDASGQVSIPQTVAGKWALIVTKDGYVTYNGGLDLKKGDNGTTYVSISKEPAKLYAFSGLVTDYVSGNALADVQVSLAGDSVKTDAAGGFAFDKLAAGPMALTISKTGFVTNQQTVTITATPADALKVVLVPAGQVLFVSNRDGKRALYTATYDGKNQQQLIVPVAGTEDYGPSISPDGKWIIFSSTRDKIANNYGDGYVPRLYIVGIDGKGLKKVSDDLNASKVIWGGSSRFVYFEAYSDAKLTSFTHKFYDVTSGTVFDLGEDAASLAFSHAGIHALYAVSHSIANPDGTNAYVYDVKTVDLISSQRRTIVSNVADFYTTDPMTFSTDDKTITYQTQGTDGRKRYQASFLTGNPSQISVSADPPRTYILSPDGTEQAFIDTRDGKQDLFMVDTQGGNEVRLTTLGVVSITAPVSWDPSSHYLTFAVVREGETAIYIVSSSGGNVQKVVDFTADSQPIPYY